jgi:hypothetical protein
MQVASREILYVGLDYVSVEKKGTVRTVANEDPFLFARL